MEPNLELLETLAAGRRVTNLCMFSWLVAAAFRVYETHPFADFFFIGSMVAAFVGTMRVAAGLELSTAAKWIASLGSAVPLVGLLVMGWTNARAVTVLQSAGYTVGMFQSSRAREA